MGHANYKDMLTVIIVTYHSDKIIQRLKREASSIGANGIVIKSTYDKNKQAITTNENGTNIDNMHYKVVTATAIFVK